MARALQLAALAEGRTSPNPLVGAVVLDVEGRLVGEGFHARAGEAHAEVGALAQAGERARGGTLVVTLEPCCHHGRTPPCSEAVLAAGIARVVLAMADPNPRVAGGGIARLRAAGLEVIDGVMEAEARRLNAPFLHRIATGRPLGILKWAMSLDGRTALPNGVSQWISGPQARDWVHGLRARCDAVIVGGGTVRADDPLLTSRGRRTPEPLRVVLSRGLDLPVTARLWDPAPAVTLLAHGPEAPQDRRDRCDRLGVERLALEACEPAALAIALARRGCNRVLWECGPVLAAAALRQGCIQQLAAVIAPTLLGGLPARTPLADLGLESLEDGWALSGATNGWLGRDLLWQGSVDRAEGARAGDLPGGARPEDAEPQPRHGPLPSSLPFPPEDGDLG
jgi:diaminohydroxyphosphoribosylaminopyrimidine deaminase/5-amino-6-(5-phosphoribosylamino)uracil reductase